MKKNILYVYKGSNGVVWTPILLPMEHTTMTQLVADAGMVLTDGSAYVTIVDVDDDAVGAWREVALTPDIAKLMNGGVE